MSRYQIGDRVRATALLGALPLDGSSNNWIAAIVPGTLGTIVPNTPLGRKLGTYAVRFDQLFDNGGHVTNMDPATAYTPAKAVHITRA